jgi:hypothetical protein
VNEPHFPTLMDKKPIVRVMCRKHGKPMGKAVYVQGVGPVFVETHHLEVEPTSHSRRQRVTNNTRSEVLLKLTQPDCPTGTVKVGCPKEHIVEGPISDLQDAVRSYLRTGKRKTVPWG